MSDSPGLDQRLRDLARTESIQRVALGIGAPPAGYASAGEADLTFVVYHPSGAAGRP